MSVDAENGVAPADSSPEVSHPESSTAETVRTFLRLLERGDIDSWMDLWAEDGEQFYPFGTEMFPPHLVGKQAIHERWKDMPGMFEVLSFPIRELWVDGDTVLARFDSRSVLKAGHADYLNTYLGIFKFDSMGKLAQYWEYFDPIVAGVNFGLATVAYPGPGAAGGQNGQNGQGGPGSQDGPDGASTAPAAGTDAELPAGTTPNVVVQTSGTGLRARIDVTISLDPPGQAG